MRNTVIRLLACALVCALLLQFAGCGSGKGAVPAAAVMTVSGKIAEHTSQTRDPALHLLHPDKLGSPIASSGLMQLYLDSDSYGIALYERTREKYWYALPTTAAAGSTAAATLTLDVLYGNTMYKLNSQDDSVQYGNAAFHPFNDGKRSGLSVFYIITADETAARKITDKSKILDNTVKASDFARTDVAFKVIVTYELRDGNLYVTADWKNLSENADAVVCGMSLLPFFGASTQGAAGDYFLLPDGCGTLLHTDVQDPAFTPIDLRVYGDDPAVPSESQAKSALFPAFAAKQGDNAFAVIIEQGDALATIHAERVSAAQGFNTVGARFTLTQMCEGEKNGSAVTFVSKNTYTEPIRLCVRLLGGANAELDGVAAACREQFMRMGYLSTDTLQNEEYMPFHLNILGAVSGNKLGFPQILTNFDEAQDLLSRMKSKGVNNIDIRYLGALRGGTNAQDAGRLDLAMRMGGRKDLRKLADYTTAQGHSLYLDASLLSVRAQGSFSGVGALNIKSETASAKQTVGDRIYTRKLLRPSTIEGSVVRLLTDAKKITPDGFCISDVSSCLSSDYAQGYTDRLQARDLIAENLPALSTDRLLMVDTGYFYAVRYADVISGLPQTSGYAERDRLYTCVPFVQMILHGSLDYSGDSVNLTADSVRTRLRAVEYGCCPSYTWCFSRSGGEKLCYEEQLNDAVSYYLAVNDALAGLRDARITDNGAAAPGVHYTKYDNGAIIYVNYTDKQATVGNIRVDALSFLRIG